MPESNPFGINWRLIEQIKMWTHHYKHMGLTQYKIWGLIERRKRNGKIYSAPLEEVYKP